MNERLPKVSEIQKLWKIMKNYEKLWKIMKKIKLRNVLQLINLSLSRIIWDNSRDFSRFLRISRDFANLPVQLSYHYQAFNELLLVNLPTLPTLLRFFNKQSLSFTLLSWKSVLERPLAAPFGEDPFLEKIRLEKICLDVLSEDPPNGEEARSVKEPPYELWSSKWIAN